MVYTNNGNDVNKDEKKNMLPKNYRVSIGRLLDLHFSNQRDALAFIAGFKYARHQHDKIIYEFKDSFKTRGFAFAFKIMHWLEKENLLQEWRTSRPYLTIISTNGNDALGSEVTQQPQNFKKSALPHSAANHPGC
jgi:hypothetical protein